MVFLTGWPPVPLAVLPPLPPSQQQVEHPWAGWFAWSLPSAASSPLADKLFGKNMGSCQREDLASLSILHSSIYAGVVDVHGHFAPSSATALGSQTLKTPSGPLPSLCFLQLLAQGSVKQWYCSYTFGSNHAWKLRLHFYYNKTTLLQSIDSMNHSEGRVFPLN